MPDEQSLGLDGGSDGIPRSYKRNEKCITLSINFMSTEFLKDGAEQSMMVGEDTCVVVAQLLQEACRPLDVGEEEGDRPGRQARHG